MTITGLGRLTVLALVLLVLAPGAAGGQTPGHIVFSSERSGDFDIYSTSEDGADVQRLTTDPAVETEPAWSPDRSQVAFVRYEGDRPDIWLLDIASGEERRLTTLGSTQCFNPGGGATSPTWSPDGDQIAFVATCSEFPTIHVVQVDSGETRVLIEPAVGTENLDPAWSPDGSLIAFARRVPNHSFDIYLASASSGEIVAQLTSDPSDDFSPAWSPDARTLAYVTGSRPSTADIAVINTDCSGASVLRTSLVPDLSPSWSPDGTRIVFVSEQDENHDLYTMDRSGGNVTQVTSDPSSDVSPDWGITPGAVEAPPLPPSGSCAVVVESGPCQGMPEGTVTERSGGGVVRVGTPGNDILTGTDGDDIICGLGGDDIIDAGAGKDLVVGNQGNDTIDGGTGKDTLRGGADDDTIDGGDKNDVIKGGGGDDRLRGNSGWDTIRGGRGKDTLQGGRGNDILRGGRGHDTLKGFTGDDLLNGGRGTDTCRPGRGNDTVKNCER